MIVLFLMLSLQSSQMKYLKFETDGVFNSNRLYDELEIDRASWYQFWKDQIPQINVKIINSLEDSLINFYKSQGYYHVTLDANETNTTVTFNIHANNPIIIDSIKTNLEPKYKKLIKLKTKQKFKAFDFISSKKEIKKKMLEDGFCNFKLKAKTRIDIEKDISFVTFFLTKNKKCKIGDIRINAPKNIHKKVISSRLNFKKGDDYSSKKIKDSYSTLSGLGAFDRVQIGTKKRDNNINIDINLMKKAKRIRQELGIGYETNLGPKGIFRWEQRNYKGDAKKLSFELKYSNQEKLIKNSFFWPAISSIPYYPHHHIDLNNEFIYSEINLDTFNEKKYANYLHFMKDYYLYSIDLGVGLEHIKIEKKGDICNVVNGKFLLFFPFAKFIIDTRDSKLNPKNGLYLSNSFEMGIKSFANSSTYSKFITELRVIQTIGDITIAGKGKLGLIQEFENKLPESKLFLGGGAFSNRAYGYKKIGAYDASCDEVGGKTMIATTIEASYPIYKKLEAAIFYDTTLISKNSFYFNTDFRHSVGFGFRYLTPIGPVKIDFGVDIENYSQNAIHFQIGQSF